jgi:hypothetical protein
VPPKGTKRDPLLDCPIIKLYRDIVHLQMNYLQRRFVADKVSCCERGQRIWRDTLEELMLAGNIYRVKDIPYVVKIWENQYYLEFSGQGSGFQKWEESGNG